MKACHNITALDRAAVYLLVLNPAVADFDRISMIVNLSEPEPKEETEEL